MKRVIYASSKDVTHVGPLTIVGGIKVKYCKGDAVNVEIPEGVTEIGRGAFAYCKSLKHVTLPSSLNTIGQKAFFDCESLLSIEIPNGVVKIPAYAFAHCYSLSHVKLPDTLEYIGEAAFCLCTSIQSIDIPDSVQKIVNDAFYKCNQLSGQVPDKAIGKKVRRLEYYGVYTFNEDEGEIDHAYDADTLDEAKEYISQNLSSEAAADSRVDGMHVVAIPKNPDNPRTEDYFLDELGIDMYEIVYREFVR